MPSRRKQAAIDIPSTRAEADALVRDYARLEHRAGEVRGFAEVQILKAKETRDAVLGVIEKDQSAIFERLKGWWEAHGQDEAGKKRSIKVDGTEIGIRLTNPKLTILGKLKKAAALDWLRSKGLPQFIRTKEEIDKPGLIKALRSRKGCDEALAELLDESFAVTQKDEFFVAVAPLEKPKIEGEVK